MATRQSTTERFLNSVSPEPNTGCWLWTGPQAHPFGYGSFWLAGRLRGAHCAGWIIFKGLIPEGLEVDHKCRVPACVNPDHLEPVTHAENMRRSPIMNNAKAVIAMKALRAAQTHCKRGHELIGENLIPSARGRECRACAKIRRGHPATPKTHCKHGHEYTEENTGTRKDGRGRFCRACMLTHVKAFRKNHRAHYNWLARESRRRIREGQPRAESGAQ